MPAVSLRETIIEQVRTKLEAIASVDGYHFKNRLTKVVRYFHERVGDRDLVNTRVDGPYIVVRGRNGLSALDGAIVDNFACRFAVECRFVLREDLTDTDLSMALADMHRAVLGDGGAGIDAEAVEKEDLVDDPETGQPSDDARTIFHFRYHERYTTPGEQ